jgi:hypothetical protein
VLETKGGANKNWSKIAFRLREPSVNFVQNSGNTFSSSELQEDSVCANFAHTAEDGHEIKKELK